MDFRVENVVAAADLGCRVDLTKASRIGGFRRSGFPSVVLKLRDPKAAVLAFESGKIVCAGAKSEDEARRAVASAVKKLSACCEKPPRSVEVKITNIVASGSLGGEVDLEGAARVLDRVIYEPEQFPALICSVRDPRAVVLVFSNGKIVCAGAKSLREARAAVEGLKKRLDEAGLIRRNRRWA